jgi:hypothetical protein
MALGLRSRGIASRVVGGYLGAERSRLGSELIVRESRAHLWVEVHSPGLGWVAFDPTPAEGRIPVSGWVFSVQDAWESVVRAWDGAVIGLTIGDQMNLLSWVGETARSLARYGLRAAPVVIPAVLAAFVLGTALRRRKRRLTLFGPRRSGFSPEYRRFLTIAARRGIHIRPVETPAEFALRAGSDLGDPEAVQIISCLYERDRFGGIRPTKAEARAAKDALERLRLLGKLVA